jgi:hypothetical protein
MAKVEIIVKFLFKSWNLALILLNIAAVQFFGRLIFSDH